MPRRTKRNAIAAISMAATCAAAASAQDWEVVWQDEFNGTEIDPEHWEHMIGDGSEYGIPGWGNNELQYYTDRPDNSFVQDGLLHIVAKEERFEGRNYTSARLRTYRLVDIKYGRIEARIRVPRGQGIWPAFWMLPTDSPYGGWAAGGELDIFETINIPDRVHGSMHFGGAWPRNDSRSRSHSLGVDLSEDFHIYTMDWTPDTVTWYIDGILYYQVQANQWWCENALDNPRAPFDNPFHMLLNVAVGGNWPGSPDDTTVFPQTLTVDWVRVSKPPQTPFGALAHAIPGRIEAEEFDEGWSRQAYFDTDAGNVGGQSRPESDVDIEVCAEGGHNVGWFREGEWIEFTVEVDRAGVYDMAARIATPVRSTLGLEIDGRTRQIEIDATGGWQNWTTVKTRPFRLSPGTHIVRVSNAGDWPEEFNLNWIEFRSTLRQAVPLSP